LPASQASTVDADDGFRQRPLAVRVRHIAGQQVGHLVDTDPGDCSLVIWHDGQPASWCPKRLLRFATAGPDGRTPLSPPAESLYDGIAAAGTAAVAMLRDMLGDGPGDLHPSPRSSGPRGSSTAAASSTATDEQDPNQLAFDGL